MERLLGDLVSSSVVVEEADPDHALVRESDLVASEWALVARAVSKRRQEFALGRVLARRAARRLGIDIPELLADSRRAPVWPREILGSISHTDGYCGVALTRRRSGISIGVDVEVGGPLERGLWSIVCSPAEWARLPHDDFERCGRLLKLVFSAKESAYKAQYPLTHRFLDFSALEVELSLDVGTWTARFTEPVHRFRIGDRIHGRWREHGGLVATVAEIPLPPPGPGDTE